MSTTETATEPERVEEQEVEAIAETTPEPLGRPRGMITLPGLVAEERDDVTNYVLVHHELLDDMFGAWEELPHLRKGLRTLQRKLNRERRQGKLLLTRTARKLRKARAGRDRRERQLEQLRTENAALAGVLDVMANYREEATQD